MPAGVGAEIVPTPAARLSVDVEIDRMQMTQGARPWPCIWPSVEELFGTRVGQTAVVLGSGPSLREFDMRRLADPSLYVIAINHEPFLGHPFVPDAWIYHDLPVANGHRLDALPGGVRIIASKVNAYQCCLGGTSGHAAKGPAVWRDNPTSIFAAMDVRAWKFGPGGVPNAGMEQHLPIARTTGTMAVGLLACMGFAKVLLLGVDLSYVVKEPEASETGTQQPLYYGSGAHKKGMRPQDGKDKHLGGDRWQTPNLGKMMMDFDLLDGTMRKGGWRGQLIQTNLCAPGALQHLTFENAVKA